MKYLLDTNVCINYMRGKSVLLLQRFGAHPPTDIVLCSVVVAELRYGAEASGMVQREHAKLDVFAAQFVSLPFDDVAAPLFGEIRHALASTGKLIGPFDTMIAAVALAHNLRLVTHNTSEFSRVSGGDTGGLGSSVAPLCSATKSVAKYRFDTRLPFSSRKNTQQARWKCQLVCRTRRAVEVVHDDPHDLADDELRCGVIHRVTG